MDLNRLVSKYQSIKIVPSIEDSLRSTGFNAELDEATQLWLCRLKTIWRTWKKSTTLENHIESFLETTSDPYHISLAAIIKCEEYKDCKPKSLPYCIVEVLGKMACKLNISPNEHIKLPAFQVAIQQRSQHFLNLVVKIYNITSIKPTILPIIKNMIKEGNHRQASQIVIATEMFSEVPTPDLLFPLVLQDKMCLIDDYLTQCPSQVKPFLFFLDEMLDKNYNFREFAQNYIDEHKITDIKYEKLHCKPLGKLVARLCNKFKIPINTCKNLSKNRTTGGLRYLIYQKYQEKNISCSVWDDIVKDSLKQNPESALDFIDLLADYDKKEALKWAEYLNLPENDYPEVLKNITVESETVQENWDNEPNAEEYFKLPVQSVQIVIIDDSEKFYDMMTVGLKNCFLISIDCEWKPSFGATPSQVALIQISTNEKVYLIDTVILNKQEFTSFWYTFYKSILDNAEIVKLGFGLEQDLKEIKSTIIGLGNIKVKGEGLLDLALLWKALVDIGLTLPYNSEDSGASLSSLVKSCFNLPLAKTEQCSNWELRPLRKTQMEYAALDAYVLMEIYVFLQNICHKQGICFEEVCNNIMLEGKQKNMKKTKVAERLKESFSNENRPKNKVEDIRFLVEPKLSFLLSHLRYFGLDTIVMSTSMLWHDIIDFAVSENRYILVPKMKYSPTSKYPHSNICAVNSSDIKEQLQKIINYFNIVISPNSVLSRCIYCNSVELTKLSKDDISNLYKKYQINENTAYANYEVDEDHDAKFDNFLSDSDDDHDVFYVPVTKNVKNCCMTSKGTPIDMCDIVLLVSSQSGATLCEICGKLLWKGQELIKTFSDIMPKLNFTSIN